MVWPMTTASPIKKNQGVNRNITVPLTADPTASCNAPQATNVITRLSDAGSQRFSGALI